MYFFLRKIFLMYNYFTILLILLRVYERKTLPDRMSLSLLNSTKELVFSYGFLKRSLRAIITRVLHF